MTHTPHASRPVKQLTRSRANRQLAGVCGGVTSYTGIDATIVRLGVVLVTLFTWGLGAVAYLLAAIVMPEESTDHTPTATEPTHATPTYSTPPTDATFPVTVPPAATTDTPAPAETPADEVPEPTDKPTPESKPTDTP